MVGFDIHAGPPGSTSHWSGGIFENAMTKNQFRSKGKTLALLAKSFIADGLMPSPEMRPQFVQQEIDDIREERREKRTPAQKLSEVSDMYELLIFFKYYDGYKTGGEIGFSPNAGPPGTVNHKRAYMRILGNMSDTQFRYKGRVLANLAKEFVDGGIMPPEDLRPQVRVREPPTSMIAEASRGGEY